MFLASSTCLITLFSFSLAKFPSDFLFGVATASYQIEGAWNTNGKGENIWDHLTHYSNHYIVDHSNGDVACDSYHKIDEDIKLLVELGVKTYRFSLAWPRILPEGFASKINQDGINYYNNLINALLKNDIVPFVTIYHWDLPENLQELGGWANPLMQDYFLDYCNVIFNLFGDRVKFWLTFNEPNSICQEGYGVALGAPAYKLNGIGDYLCGHNLLLSHARAYDLYKRKFQREQNGQIGIVLNPRWFEPKTNSTENIQAAQRALDFLFGWFADPILHWNYPQSMIDRVANLSREENYPNSRLPQFTSDQIELLHGSYDFIGINHYSTSLVSDPLHDIGPSPSVQRDARIILEMDPSWPYSSLPWLRVAPFGLYKILMYIKNTYNNPTVYVTENGFSDLGTLNDLDRINYHKGYLDSVSRALDEGCDIKGYMIWSLMDNFEWFDGYTQKFGLYHVNFTDPSRPRSAKASTKWYKNYIMKSNEIPQTKLVL